MPDFATDMSDTPVLPEVIVQGAVSILQDQDNA